MSSEPARQRGQGEPVESTGASADRTEPSIDDVFEVLSNRRRRYTLHHLQRRDEPVELGNLSERVAAWENETGIEKVTSAERKRVYTALQQFHLPKMEDSGLIEYDQRGSIVELTDTADTLDVYLDIVPEDDIPWSQFYAGLSTMSLLLVGLVVVGVPPLTTIPVTVWAFLIVLTFAISALVHVYRDRRLHIGTDDTPPERRSGSS